MITNNYKNIIKEKLSNKRYNHCLCVAKEAVRLAKIYGADEKKVQTAALLHDIMKDTSLEEQEKFLKSANINLNKLEKATPKLWHAILGAEYIKLKLDVCDKDIINAVKYHTTGRENMTLIEKIIFVADFTSDDRDYVGVNKMREASNRSLKEAMIEGVSFTISDLVAKNMPIHQNTILLYNSLILEKR